MELKWRFCFRYRQDLPALTFSTSRNNTFPFAALSRALSSYIKGELWVVFSKGAATQPSSRTQLPETLAGKQPGLGFAALGTRGLMPIETGATICVVSIMSA